MLVFFNESFSWIKFILLCNLLFFLIFLWGWKHLLKQIGNIHCHRAINALRFQPQNLELHFYLQFHFWRKGVLHCLSDYAHLLVFSCIFFPQKRLLLPLFDSSFESVASISQNRSFLARSAILFCQFQLFLEHIDLLLGHLNVFVILRSFEARSLLFPLHRLCFG